MNWMARGGVVVVLLMVFEGVSRAESPQQQQAKQQWEKGTVEYSLGHYDEAIRRYEDAYRLIQDPGLLFNLGQSYRLSGASEKALATYRSYLRRSPPTAPDRALAEKHIAELEATRRTKASDVAPAPPSIAVPAAIAPPESPLLLGNRVRGQDSEPSSRTSSSHWWVWCGAAMVVGAGFAAAFLLSQGPDGVPGSVGTVRVP